MVSLFSSFDLFFFFFNFLFFLVLPFLFFCTFFFHSCVTKLNSTLFSFVYNLVSLYNLKNYYNMFFYLFTILFFCILLFNLNSVFPYVFPFTSQVSLVIFVAFSFWVSSLVFFLYFNFKSFIIHLIPEGCPMGLSFFLFLIELVSVSIRPITLMVRLTANILAGHILLILLCSLVLAAPLSFPLYLLLTGVEFFVAIIQSYIFLTMLSLYMSEVE